MDVQGALELMAAVSTPDVSSPTYYTIIIDTSSMILYLYVAATEDDDAPLQSGHVLPMEELFSVLPP